MPVPSYRQRIVLLIVVTALLHNWLGALTVEVLPIKTTWDAW